MLGSNEQRRIAARTNNVEQAMQLTAVSFAVNV
jgi:hypothetical protein